MEILQDLSKYLIEVDRNLFDHNILQKCFVEVVVAHALVVLVLGRLRINLGKDHCR